MATPTMPPRGASPARVLDTEPMRTEEEEVDLGTGGPVPATDVGGEGATSSHPSTGEAPVFPFSSFFWILILALPHFLFWHPDPPRRTRRTPTPS